MNLIRKIRLDGRDARRRGGMHGRRDDRPIRVRRRPTRRRPRRQPVVPPRPGDRAKDGEPKDMQPGRPQGRRARRRPRSRRRSKGPKTEAARAIRAAAKLTAGRDRRDQGIARGRAGRWRSSRRSAPSAASISARWTSPQGQRRRPDVLPLLRELREGSQERSQGGHRQARCQGGPEMRPRRSIGGPETARPVVDALIHSTRLGSGGKSTAPVYSCLERERDGSSKPHAL